MIAVARNNLGKFKFANVAPKGLTQCICIIHNTLNIALQRDIELL